MRLNPTRAVLGLLSAAALLSCSDSPNTAPLARQAGAASRTVSPGTRPNIVISQVYGGGGNSGATLTNDFIELFNPGSDPVSVNGLSVQYASATGTTWQVTTLSGSIAGGGYYLVQESQGSGGTTALPAPDATGSIAMSATAGKVWLVASTVAETGACPADAAVIDEVSFGTTASDCGFKRTPAPSNTNSELRGDGGCAFTGDLSADFATGAPAPRNTASATRAACAGVTPAGALDHVALTGPSTVTVGASVQLTAIPQDANDKTVTAATVSWKSSDETIATVDGAGKVTGVKVSATPATITATATANGITKLATLDVTVSAVSIKFIDVSTSSTSFPPGFQAQMFATARTAAGGTVVPANFVFEAVDPDIATVATVQNTGIITGVAAPADGTTRPGIRIIATPADGLTPPDTFVTHAIFIETPAPAPTSIYAKNDEFGDPTAAASDPNNLLITRPQYTLSYNESHGTPNWVSYELDARQMAAGQDRCNCFTADPNLPAAKQIFTSDYTNGGFDRGHMTRSADRTAGNTDNAATYYLTNVVPQQADLNQGVWAQFENALADSANKGGRAVYIITGPLYSPSHGLAFLKNEGKVAIPDSTWKVAFIGPRDGSVPFNRSTIQTWGDLAGTTLLAVNMPNVSGVRNDPWQKYVTTVDRIEASTGYDFLSLLPTVFQTAIEAGDHAPTAAFTESGAANEGSALTFDASASTDPDLGRTDLGRTEVLTYTWHFSDGANASGQTATHAFADNGTYSAVLTVADAFGWQSVSSQSIVVANVAPAVTFTALSPLSIQSGDSVAAAGSFIDPGPDATWNASIDWGDGTVNKPVPSSFSQSGANMLGGARYFVPGSYTATLTVTDKDGGAGSSSLAFTVVSRSLRAEVQSGRITLGDKGSDDIDVLLYGDLLAHVTDLDVASVRIGTVGVTTKHDGGFDTNLEAAGLRMRLRFSRQALIAAGLLAPGTTQVDLVANLTNGIQIIAHVPVAVMTD
ncbi:MAG TPA: DNA/RNA non-specific endonuclease [Gemmatimonadaceae bacterium]|nr:DNA/RNA non-specific endonuclease [Gemmatimonadaceae bacterium]